MDISSSSALLQSAIVTSFTAVGPIGMSIIVNQRIGSPPSKLVFVAIVQVTLIEMTGQIMNRTTSIRRLGIHGIELKASPRFILRRAAPRDTPTTTTYRLTNSWPMFEREDVRQALRNPPSSVLLKKALCRGGTRPMTAPKVASITALLKNA